MIEIERNIQRDKEIQRKKKRDREKRDRDKGRQRKLVIKIPVFSKLMNPYL